MTSLVGTVRPTGKIQFLEKDNAAVFKQIRASKSEVHRIKLDPNLQTIEIRKPEEGADNDFPWLEEFTSRLSTADAVYLSHKDGALRFGSAVHVLEKTRKYYTIGTVQEASKFADERWCNVRYFFANKFDDFRFYMTTMMTYKKGKVVEGGRIELPVRIDTVEDIDEPVAVFDATGSNATMEIVDWRNSVNVGTVGRFAVDSKKVRIMISKITRPFTFLEEFREEFDNYAYTFACDKANQRLEKLIAKKQKAREASA